MIRREGKRLPRFVYIGISHMTFSPIHLTASFSHLSSSSYYYSLPLSLPLLLYLPVVIPLVSFVRLVILLTLSPSSLIFSSDDPKHPKFGKMVATRPEQERRDRVMSLLLEKHELDWETMMMDAELNRYRQAGDGGREEKRRLWGMKRRGERELMIRTRWRRGGRREGEEAAIS